MKTLRNAAVALLFVVATGAMLESPAPQGQAQARRALPGDLTKPIAQYTGDEFNALVGPLPYAGGRDRPRRCTAGPNCTTVVHVDAVTGEDSLSAGNLPQFGIVALKAVVRGNNPDAMYGMQPNGPNGQYSYYLIVNRGAGGAATWSLEELRVQANVRTHRTLRSGRFTPCNHPYIPGARADFRTCNEPAADAGGVRITFASFGPGAQGDEPPFWISCALGCCTAEG